MRLLLESPLHQRFRANWEEFRECLMAYSVADYCVGLCYSNCESILAKLNLSVLYSRWQHLLALYIINVSKRKIIFRPHFIVSVRLPTIHLWLITISNSTRQLGVFLLPVLFYRTLLYLISIIHEPLSLWGVTCG